MTLNTLAVRHRLRGPAGARVQFRLRAAHHCARPFRRHMSYETLAMNQIAAGALLGALTFWWIETPRLTWTPGLVIALAVTSLLATALAFSIQSWAQQFTTPTRTAVIFTLEPVFAWLTSFVVAGELLTVAGRVRRSSDSHGNPVCGIETDPLRRSSINVGRSPYNRGHVYSRGSDRTARALNDHQERAKQCSTSCAGRSSFPLRFSLHIVSGDRHRDTVQYPRQRGAWSVGGAGRVALDHSQPCPTRQRVHQAGP